MGLSVKLLGQFEVRDSSGTVLTLPTRKTRALLGYLTINADKPQPRERLMALLWSDRGDKQARQSLNHSLRAIRKLAEEQDIVLLESDGETVMLRGAALDSDVARFRELLSDHPSEAADLYTGPFLDGLSVSDHAFEEWLRETQSQFHTQACDALQAAAMSDDSTMSEDINTRIDRLRHLLTLDPLREEAHRQLMQLLHQSGDRPGALRQYQVCVDILNNELQVEPDATTKALYEEIHSDDGIAVPKDIKLQDNSTPQKITGSQDIPEPQAAENPQEVSMIRKIPRRWLIGVVAVLLLVTAGLAISLMTQTDIADKGSQEDGLAEISQKLSIAVLPFVNMSDDDSQEYFVDGMADDLITDLSKIAGLFVIARNSTFAYKGKSIDLGVVARELEVRYVLEGSVRKVGDKVRINAQLVDASTGGHLWADRYDDTLKNVFAMQDKITAEIVTALRVALGTPDGISLTDGKTVEKIDQITPNTGRTDDIVSAAAYDEYLQGWSFFHKRTPQSFVTAVRHFERAIVLEPNYTLAHAALASVYWESWKRFWQRHLGLSGNFPAWEQADKHLELAFKSPSPLAHRIKAEMLFINRRYDSAIAEAEKAIAINPNDALGYAVLAEAKTFAGLASEAIPLMEKAIRLDPHSPPSFLYSYGLAQFGLAQYGKAAEYLERAIQKNNQDPLWYVLLIAVYGHLNETEKAKIAYAHLVNLQNAAGLRRFSVNWPYGRWPFKNKEDRERLRSGLLAGGMPEY